jgi:hypothetical protein
MTPKLLSEGLVALMLLGLAVGCAGKQPSGSADMPKANAKWEVFDGEVLVLEVWDEPGPLLSTAAPPPDFEAPTHPFLSATAHSAAHEDRLRQLLERSTNLQEFLEALRADGFEVKQVHP